jgi:hypothetical protein
MTPEALDGLALEERHRIYKMMNLKTTALLDGVVEVNSAITPSDEFGTSDLASCR